jgi:hypothetical protein
MVTIVVSTMCYFHFVSYASTLATFSVVGLYLRRLSSSVLAWIGGDVLLDASSVSYVVSDVACGVSGGVGWRVGRGVGGSVGSEVDRLHHFVFTSSLFSHKLKGTIAPMSLAGCSDLLLEKELAADLLYPGPLSST